MAMKMVGESMRALVGENPQFVWMILPSWEV